MKSAFNANQRSLRTHFFDANVFISIMRYKYDSRKNNLQLLKDMFYLCYPKWLHNETCEITGITLETYCELQGPSPTLEKIPGLLYGLQFFGKNYVNETYRKNYSELRKSYESDINSIRNCLNVIELDIGCCIFDIDLYSLGAKFRKKYKIGKTVEDSDSYMRISVMDDATRLFLDFYDQMFFIYFALSALQLPFDKDVRADFGKFPLSGFPRKSVVRNIDNLATDFLFARYLYDDNTVLYTNDRRLALVANRMISIVKPTNSIMHVYDDFIAEKCSETHSFGDHDLNSDFQKRLGSVRTDIQSLIYQMHSIK